MTTDTRKKPASGDGDRKAFEKWAAATRLYRMQREEIDARFYEDPLTQSAWEGYRAAIRYRDELEANRKCDCTFLCKFCRERRDELEKGHE